MDDYLSLEEIIMLCSLSYCNLRRRLFLLLSFMLLANSIAISQAAHFVYVINELSDSISAYTMNPASGDLTPVAGSPFSTPHMPHRLAINPSGTNAYLVTDDSSTARLVTFSIDRTSGALTAKDNQPLPSPSFSVPTIEPSGRILLLASARSGDIRVYRLTPGSGIPSLAGSLHAGNSPWSSTVDSVGKFVFLAGNSNSVVGYAVDAQRGSLTPVPGSPFTVRAMTQVAGHGPISQIAVLHSSGNFLYVSDPVRGTISAFSVDRGNGSIHPVAGSPFSTQGILPFEAALEVHGKFLYMGDWHRGLIAAFSIGTSGELAPVPGSPFHVPFTSGSTQSGGTALAIDPSGNFLYATSTERNEIVGFSIDPGTGALTPLLTAPIPTGKHPFRVVVSQ
jgi:6-phosphogluconolactonase (cycloisomerase 2 family)